MSSAKKFAPDIPVNPNYLVTLKAMEYEAYKWGLAAVGLRPSYNNPVGKLIAADVQRQALDRYFNAIEALIQKKTDGEPA